ncbi:Oxidoreductase [Rickettsia canadensis str. McKiel]|uniref:Oxidoreductase n=1 Tax=Rickettsia canadensis (strain McKiel) TaxID=293613 RepID=A8F0A6_RICCK|nr:Oxidoreductase [Rickettsia canadensis str. McKiel]
MKDKVTVITGSTSGIGLKIAKHFAKLESKIVINGFTKEDEVAKISAELKELGASSVFYQGINLEKPDEIRSMFEKIIKEFGKIDILVNNAGIQHVAPIDEFPEDKWEQILRIDLIASFYTTKYVIPIMKKTALDESSTSLPLMHMLHHHLSQHM